MRLAKSAAEDGEPDQLFSPVRPGPPLGSRTLQGSAYSSAMTLLPNRLVLPSLNLSSHILRRGWRGVSQTPNEVPSVSFLGTPPRVAQKVVERQQLQFPALASRGQQRSTRGQVWGPWVAQSSPPALGLDVKCALSHPVHRKPGESLQHNPAGGKLLHSFIHSFIHSVSQVHGRHAVNDGERAFYKL